MALGAPSPAQSRDLGMGSSRERRGCHEIPPLPIVCIQTQLQIDTGRLWGSALLRQHNEPLLIRPQQFSRLIYGRHTPLAAINVEPGFAEIVSYDFSNKYIFL